MTSESVPLEIIAMLPTDKYELLGLGKAAGAGEFLNIFHSVFF